MKKIFTLLFSFGLAMGVFAQSGYRNQNQFAGNNYNHNEYNESVYNSPYIDRHGGWDRDRRRDNYGYSSDRYIVHHDRDFLRIRVPFIQVVVGGARRY